MPFIVPIIVIAVEAVVAVALEVAAIAIEATTVVATSAGEALGIGGSISATGAAAAEGGALLGAGYTGGAAGASAGGFAGAVASVQSALAGLTAPIGEAVTSGLVGAGMTPTAAEMAVMIGGDIVTGAATGAAEGAIQGGITGQDPGKLAAFGALGGAVGMPLGTAVSKGIGKGLGGLIGEEAASKAASIGGGAVREFTTGYGASGGNLQTAATQGLLGGALGSFGKFDSSVPYSKLGARPLESVLTGATGMGATALLPGAPKDTSEISQAGQTGGVGQTPSPSTVPGMGQSGVGSSALAQVLNQGGAGGTIFGTSSDQKKKKPGWNVASLRYMGNQDKGE